MSSTPNLGAFFIQNQNTTMDSHHLSPHTSYIRHALITLTLRFYGPMAFDVAKIIGELLLTLFATHGLELQEGDKKKGGRDAQRGESGGTEGGRGTQRMSLSTSGGWMFKVNFT